MKSNYLAIMDWMLDLGLNHNELTAYAIVWSFSRDGESWFQGTATYISRWMCVADSRPALRALASLVEKGLIEKRDRWENGVRLCDYRAVGGTTLKALGVLPEKYRGTTTKAVGGTTTKAVHNTIIDNGYKYPNRDQNAHTRVKVVHGRRFQEVWEVLLRQPGWTGKSADALDECLRDLNAVTEDEAVDMMRNSIKNGWRGLFPLERRSTEPDDIESAIAAADRMEREITERMAARAAANDIKS